MTQITSPPTAPAHPCQPWCSDHANGTPPGRPLAVEDQLCRDSVTSPAFGQVLVTHSSDEGTVLHLYGVREELTLDAAELYFRTGLALVAATRSKVSA